MAYVSTEDVEPDTLRQGDLIQDVHLIGSLCFTDVAIPTIVGGGVVPKSWSVHSELPKGPVTVLSQCCEIDRVNGVKLTSIILAPVRDVSKATRQDKLQELIDSNDIVPGQSSYSYLKYFFLEPHPSLPFRGGGLVDFSKVFSVRKTSYDFLLERKIAQMSDSTRESMAMKLALYFYRARMQAEAA
jgi:hypothetical protein